MERFHKLGVTTLTLQMVQMRKMNTHLSVCSLHTCSKEQREMMCFHMTFVGFSCITRACKIRKLLLLSNDIHSSRKRDWKEAGLGKKSLVSTNQQGGTGDKRDSIDYFSLKSVTWGRDCLVTKDHSIFSVLHQQLCSSSLALVKVCLACV